MKDAFDRHCVYDYWIMGRSEKVFDANEPLGGEWGWCWGEWIA